MSFVKVTSPVGALDWAPTPTDAIRPTAAATDPQVQRTIRRGPRGVVASIGDSRVEDGLVTNAFARAEARAYVRAERRFALPRSRNGDRHSIA